MEAKLGLVPPGGGKAIGSISLALSCEESRAAAPLPPKASTLAAPPAAVAPVLGIAVAPVEDHSAGGCRLALRIGKQRAESDPGGGASIDYSWTEPVADWHSKYRSEDNSKLAFGGTLTL